MNWRWIALTAAMGLALTPLGAAAQLRTEEECKRLQPEIESPVEYATCTNDLAGSKRALEAAFAALRQRVPTEHQPVLDEAHRAWAAHRDDQCAWEAGSYPGNSVHSAAVIGCMAGMNRDRAMYLSNDLKERWTD